MGMNLGGNSGSGRRRGARQAPFAEINITPMVDVMLVLLVIFMVAAPMMTTGVTVDLPDAKSQAVAGQDEPLSVSIGKDGKISLQNATVPLDKLAEKLKAVTHEKKDTRIFIRGDKTADYGKIMQVVGEINAAGFGKVALLTDMSGTPSARKSK